MDSTQGASNDDAVILDEWHVEVWVAREISDTEAGDPRAQIDADLRSWAIGLTDRLDIAPVLRVDVDQ